MGQNNKKPPYENGSRYYESFIIMYFLVPLELRGKQNIFRNEWSLTPVLHTSSRLLSTWTQMRPDKTGQTNKMNQINP